MWHPLEEGIDDMHVLKAAVLVAALLEGETPNHANRAQAANPDS